MAKGLFVLFVPTSDPEDAARAVRHLFRRHVQSAITPPLAVERVEGGIALRLDVRVLDNYRVEEAIQEVRRLYPGATVQPEPSAPTTSPGPSGKA
jgi:hypothetical protein